MKINTFLHLLFIILLVSYVSSRCAFQIVDPTQPPLKVDKQPFIVEGLTMCKEYNGKLGCCNSGNDIQQQESYTQIDGIFSSLGDGCDICAVNLKRFWCEYACSPNQEAFTQVLDGYFPVPSPTKPDQMVQVQKVTLKINAQTACQLYHSCSRNAFVSSVSAMSTPAGFLSFLGSNAVDQAKQFMTMRFSYNKNDSIYFGDDAEDITTKPLDKCNRTIDVDSIHGFPVYKNCSCNNCAESCSDDQGFVYTQSGVLEGFNYVLVGSVWAIAIAIAFTVSTLKKKNIGEMETYTKKGKKLI